MPEQSFSGRLLAARRRAGLTQAALAERCGLTGPYISLLESGRKPAPSDEVVRRLATVLGEDRASLLETAHLDRAPEDLRRTVRHLRRQAELERERRHAGSPKGRDPGVAARGEGSPAQAEGLLAGIVRLLGVHAEDPGDPRVAREDARRALRSLPAADLARILEQFAALAPSPPSAAPWHPAPPGPLPDPVRPGDLLRLDAEASPRPGDLVLLRRDGATALERFGEGADPGEVLGVVVELRRLLPR
jgi:transcriptional regulator with XRE-family HTH domain